MPKILSAVHYGGRVVIRVVMDPSAAEYTGADGSTEKAPGVPWGNETGARYNWRVRELVWDGEELWTADGQGGRRLKTEAELLAEAKTRLAKEATPAARSLTTMVGQTV